MLSQEPHHGFHNGDRMAYLAPLRRAVDGRSLIEPLIPALGVGHDDALAQERLDSDFQSSALKASSAPNAKQSGLRPSVGNRRISGNRSCCVNQPRTTIDQLCDFELGRSGSEEIALADFGRQVTEQLIRFANVPHQQNGMMSGMDQLWYEGASEYAGSSSDGDLH